MIKHHNYHLGVCLSVLVREARAMTRYSASRGIMYSAPPANGESEPDTEAETAEPTPADD
jgi:hypothetical protein